MSCTETCECAQCQAEWPNAFEVCLRCGRKRYWENAVPLWRFGDDDRNLSGYQCADDCRRGGQ
jgi:hypothetical protein